MPIIQYETKAGRPIMAGKTKITPLARVLRIQFPGFPGGLIWNRPGAIVLQAAEGEEQVLPVKDVTRQAQILLLGLGLIGALLIWLALKPKSK
jgi:hypothetical protein